MKIAKLLCGVAFGGFLASNAMAADLLYSQPQPQAAANYGGPYVGIKGGINFSDDDIGYLDTTNGGAGGATFVELEDGFNAGIVAGYAFGSRWGMFSPRIEAELGYLSNETDTAASFTAAGVLNGGPVATNGEVNATYGLVNMLLDIPLGWGFTPFIGAGVGYGNVRFDNITSTATAGTLAAGELLIDDEDTAFAYNLTAGLSYDISRNVTLEIAYRYLSFVDVETLIPGGAGATSENDVDNHQVNVGLRVHL